MDREAIIGLEERMQRALDSYRAAKARRPNSLVARKVADLRHYDVPAMNNIVAICNSGKSGSLLLSSFLDRHRDVVMLAALRGQAIHRFLERYQSLPLREKLVTYPVLAEEQGQPFYYGDFPIPEADYYAAVEALFDVYGNHPAVLQAPRRTFIQFLHVAYSLAVGHHPAIPRPLMVYAQHAFDPVAAAQLVEDFPKARFIHTIRNPLSGFDSWFDLSIYMMTGDGQLPHPGYLDPVGNVFGSLLTTDRPHPGMAERTRAVRFEDMHLNTEGTLRSVTNWLEIPETPSPGESTFNGIPYIVESGGSAWTGPRPEQARRPLRNISRADRAALFALFYENFLAWRYPCPSIFRYAWLRRLTTKTLLIVPMKMEIATARLVERLQVRPALRLGRYGFALRALARLLTCHWHLVRRVSAELKSRIDGKWGVLEWPDGYVAGHFQVLDPVGPCPTNGATRASSASPTSDAIENPDVLAQVLIAEYSDADLVGDRVVREALGKLSIAPATVAKYLVRATTLLAPVIQSIRDHVFSARKLHATDKPVRTLCPGTGRRISGGAWIYVRDDRRFDCSAGPAVAVFYSRDRQPEHRFGHLRSFKGFLQADVRPGLEGLYDPARTSPGAIIEVACWARCRWTYTNVWGASKSEVARDALDRIAAIYAIETEAVFKSPAIRLQIRSAARPLVLSFFAWAASELGGLSAKSAVAEALCDTLARRTALTRFLEHGCLEIDNQCAENAMRGIRLNERSWTFADSDTGGQRAADICSIIGSALLNDLDPHVYLRDVLRQLMESNAISRSDRLLPWNWTMP